MNLIYDHVSSARKQCSFLASLPTNPKWEEYYKSRTPARQAALDAIMDRCNPGCWRRMECVGDLTVHFQKMHKMCSREDNPLSSYYLAVQALKNGVTKTIEHDDGKFDRLLGPGATQQVKDVLEVRFNMDGQTPPGRKVGLLDELHIWCFMVDPYSGDWRRKFKIQGNFRDIATRMIAHFVPDDEDGFMSIREELMKEFMVSHDHLYNSNFYFYF